MAYPTMPWPPPPPWPPQWPPPWPPPPGRSAVDITVSILAMILTVLVCAAGALMGLFSLAFLDHCPAGSCSTAGAVSAAVGTVAVAGLLGFTGVILTIVRLATRKPGWPFALGTLAGCVAVFVLGAMAYTVAVG